MNSIKKLVSDGRGATHLVVILAVVVIAVVGAAGYYVMKQTKSTPEKANNQASATFESKSDLEQASKALDDGQNDTDLDPAQLDTDLNELL